MKIYMIGLILVMMLALVGCDLNTQNTCKVKVDLTMQDVSNVTSFWHEVYGNASHIEIDAPFAFNGTTYTLTVQGSEKIDGIEIKFYRFGYWQGYQFNYNESFYRIDCPCQEGWCVNRTSCNTAKTHLQVDHFNLTWNCRDGRNFTVNYKSGTAIPGH